MAYSKLPIVYVRGYADPTSGIDSAVDDPFYGFNSGGTHVRVNGDGDPEFYQFEGPMLRLMWTRGTSCSFGRAGPLSGGGGDS